MREMATSLWHRVESVRIRHDARMQACANGSMARMRDIRALVGRIQEKRYTILVLS